jgi:hypothetical protein
MEKIRKFAVEAVWIAAWVAVLTLPAVGFAQTQAAGSVVQKTYLEKQEERLDLQLKNRIESMKKRFAAGQGFRIQIEEKRIAFEKTLAVERKTFMEQAEDLKGDERDKAWDAFYVKQRGERRAFNAQLKDETNKFWDNLRNQED